jgi:signal transduction histidine kinase
VDPEQLEFHLDALHNRRPFRNFVHPRTMRDGSVVWLSVNGAPYFDDDQNFKGFRGTGTNITEQVEADAAIIKSREEALHASRAKSEFLANMSHELRTPLNCILGFSEVLKDELFGPIGNAKYAEYADSINESGQHLHKIIGDILDISKIEAGKEVVEDCDIDVRAVVRDCISMVEVRADDQDIRVQENTPDDLPILRADERHVKQVVLNLLSNAIKFTAAGNLVSVGVRLNDASCVEISITDTGIGIEEDDIPKILQPFVQVAGSDIRGHGGMGLGLPICNSLMVLHGGKLRIESEFDKGTTVIAQFPPERTIRS